MEQHIDLGRALLNWFPLLIIIGLVLFTWRFNLKRNAPRTDESLTSKIDDLTKRVEKLESAINEKNKNG